MKLVKAIFSFGLQRGPNSLLNARSSLSFLHYAFSVRSPASRLLFHAFLSSAELFQKILSGTLSEYQTNPDQDQHFVGPHLGQNHLPKVISRQQKSPIARKELSP